MRLNSRLSTQDYLYYLRQNARFRLLDPCEGFSGLVIGNLFLLRYHAINGSEKQRLYKEESRRPRCTYNAFGVVKSGDYGSEIVCVYTVGFLDPVSFVFFLLVGILATLRGGFLFDEPGIAIAVVAFVLIIAIAITMFISSNACCAERGRRKVLELLEDPSNGMTTR